MSRFRPAATVAVLVALVATFVAVLTTTFTGAGAATTTPSGVAMPTGDLPGWRQVFADDFTTPTQTFPGPYAKDWTAYNNTTDTSKHGVYAKSAITMHDGMMDLHLHTVDGKAQVAAPIPLPAQNGTRTGMLYGRYSVRFKADNLPGYKTAWLLWPDDNNSQHGEIDFPEGELSGDLKAFNHVLGNHPLNALALDTHQTYGSWHTATIEWLPSGVTFYLDGLQVGHSTVSPNVPMHWVLQTETETNGDVPTAAEDGHVYIDWATMYAPTSLSQAVSPATAPGAPTSVTATAADGSATVSWAAPTATGGSPITGYTVAGSPGGSCTTTTNTCKVTGLTDGATYSFAVSARNAVGAGAAATSPAVTPTAPAVSASVSGSNMPTGDLPGWHQVFADNFATPTQTFPGPYAADWTAYNGTADTSKNGIYAKSAITMHDGMMDLHLHTVDGKAQVAAPIPLPAQNGTRTGMLYGRYAVRYKADNLPGYKTSWMLWPDSGGSSNGYISFPDGELSSTAHAYDHAITGNSQKPLSFDTRQTYGAWHTAVIDWLPTGVTYYLDGTQVASSTLSPNVPMHWVLQTETTTNGHVPTATEDGHVYVDWATMYSRSTDAGTGSTQVPAPGGAASSSATSSTPTNPTQAAGGRTNASFSSLTMPARVGLRAAAPVSARLVSSAGDTGRQRVTLQYRHAGTSSAFTTFAQAGTTAANGAVVFRTFRPASSVQVRLAYAGSQSHHGAYSAVRTITVTRSIKVGIRTSRARHGQRAVSGTVSPVAGATKVYLQRLTGGRWHTIGTTRTSSGGRYAFDLHTKRHTVYSLRLLVRADRYFASAVRQVHVRVH